MATLEQVIEFYARLGNDVNSSQDALVASISLSTNTPEIIQARQDIIAFLKSLTDERVRFKRAPFDHPEIKIPTGHDGDDVFATAGHELDAGLAVDEFMVIPAVGENGMANPDLPFDQYLPN